MLKIQKILALYFLDLSKGNIDTIKGLFRTKNSSYRLCKSLPGMLTKPRTKPGRSQLESCLHINQTYKKGPSDNCS